MGLAAARSRRHRLAWHLTGVAQSCEVFSKCPELRSSAVPALSADNLTLHNAILQFCDPIAVAARCRSGPGSFSMDI